VQTRLCAQLRLSRCALRSPRLLRFLPALSVSRSNRMTSGPQILTAAMAVVVLRLPITQAFSAFQNPSSRFLDTPILFQDNDHLQEPLEDSDSFLSLTKIFSQNDRDENNEPQVNINNGEKDSVTSAAATTSTPKATFNIDTFTFNENNQRKTGDIFSLLADVENTKPAQTDRDSQTEQRVTSSGADEVGPTTTNLPEASVANILGKNILLATKDMEDLLSLDQRMKKTLEPRTQPTDPSSSSHLINESMTTSHNISTVGREKNYSFFISFPSSSSSSSSSPTSSSTFYSSSTSSSSPSSNAQRISPSNSRLTSSFTSSPTSSSSPTTNRKQISSSNNR
ncbi:hypothetical protein Hamer_G021794, partial [Homarus americanus]